MAAETSVLTRLATYFPGETADYPISFALDTGDSIASAKVSSVSSGITITGVSATTSTTTGTLFFTITSATSGEVFQLVAEAQTAGGRRWKRGLVVPAGQRG